MKNNKIVKYIFIGLFAILYLSVALVSTYHAISFFSLANSPWVAGLLAITFEIGQAAVLFSILTGASGKSKVVPWILMCVLTLVQILGNVFSSYGYLITNSGENLRFFKEPIFVWMELPDQQCNVILTYIIGAILPIVALLMTSMVTNYLGLEDKKQEPLVEKNTEEVNNEVVEQEVPETIEDKIIEEPITEVVEETIDEPIEEKQKSRFINI